MRLDPLSAIPMWRQRMWLSMAAQVAPLGGEDMEILEDDDDEDEGVELKFGVRH